MNPSIFSPIDSLSDTRESEHYSLSLWANWFIEDILFFARSAFRIDRFLKRRVSIPIRFGSSPFVAAAAARYGKHFTELFDAGLFVDYYNWFYDRFIENYEAFDFIIFNPPNPVETLLLKLLLLVLLLFYASIIYPNTGSRLFADIWSFPWFEYGCRSNLSFLLRTRPLRIFPYDNC